MNTWNISLDSFFDYLEIKIQSLKTWYKIKLEIKTIGFMSFHPRGNGMQPQDLIFSDLTFFKYNIEKML